MEKAEYIVKFRGDYSALAKDLKNIGAETKKIEDDEVIIKLAYDGNIKEFNKVFDKISKMHPELGIQFQYNVNEKILKQEIKKLDELTELKLDVDEGKVQAKLEKLAENVEFALEERMSKDEITKRLKNVFGYYNTAIKAGAKNINFKDIKDRLDDAFSIETDEIQDIFGKVFGLNINKPIQLFKIDKSINEDIAMTQERVDDLKDSLKSLEEKGASKSGSSSEMKQLQDDIKILRSDIEDMKTQLQNLSGEAFDEMTESIKKTSEQLTGVIEKLKILSMSGVSGFEITSLKTLLSDFSEFAQKRNSKNLSDYWSELQTKIDNGDESLKKALIDLKLFNEETSKINIIDHGGVKSGGLTSNEYTLLATKEASHQTDNTINSRLQDTIVLKDKLDEAADAGVNVARILNVVYDKTSDTMFQLQETAKGVMLGGQGEAPINLEAFNASDEAIQKLISDIIYLRKIGVGVDFHGLNVFYDQISDTFSLIDMDLKPTEYGKYGENDTFENDILGGLISSFENAEGKMPEAAQKFVDRVRNILTNIDTSGIEQSAKDVTQKAADALQEAQDSNSPAELTKPLGKDFGLGYAEGIREAIPEVVKACKEVVLAAYNAVKETSDAENGEGNDLLDNFINNFKESLNNALPAIQEKIKEVFSKIDIDNKNEKTPLSSIASEDFQTQLQNTIDETGKYIIRVYGELIDDFKSRLQNSIDETGIYHVDIDGWLYDTFHDGLQRDIDGQEKYIIEVKGRLFDSFKEVLQEAIDGLEAFPIEVKPYMRKGGEIEEVDLPGGNHNSEEQLEDLSYGTDAYRTKVKQLTSSIVEMNNRGEEETVEYINTVKELFRLFDMFKKVADFPIGTNQAKKFEAFITNENLNAGFDGDDTTSDISKAGVMIIDRFIDSATSKFMNLDKMIDDIISRNGNVAKYVNPIIEAEDKFISPTQQFDNEVQQNLVMLENYENTIKEIDKLKVDPETDEAKRKIQELNKLADYFASQITVIQSENGHEVNRSMMYFNGVPNNNLMEDYSMDDIERFTRVANERTGLNRDTVFNKFVGIEEELSRIEYTSEGLRNALTKNLSDSKAYVSRVRADLINLVETYEELEHVKEGSRDYELYQKDIKVFSERTPELLQFLDKIKTYDQAHEFVKTDEWLDFLATLPQAHTYLESIGYDFNRINQISNENNLSSESVTTPSTIDEITQAEDRMGNEAQEATNQARQGLAEMREEAEKTNEELMTFYRGVDTRGHGSFGESGIYGQGSVSETPWFSSNLDIAKEYADKLGEIYEIQIGLDKIMTVDAHGSNWNHVLFLGDGKEEESKKLLSLFNTLIETKQRLTDDFKWDGSNRQLVELYTKGSKDAKQASMDYQKAKLEFDNAIRDSEKYGYTATDDLAKMAKELGYQALIVKNVMDSENGKIADNMSLLTGDMTGIKTAKLYDTKGNLVEVYKEEEIAAKANAKAQRELVDAKEKVSQASNKTPVSNDNAEKLKQKTEEVMQATEQQEQAVKNASASENGLLSSLAEEIQHVIEKIDEKNRAFQEEGQIVDGVVHSELTNLDVLSGYLINLRDEVSKVSAEFQGMDVKINIKDTGVDNITKFVSALSKIKDNKIKESLEKISLLLNNFVKDVNNLQINDNNILTAINSILSKSKELENLTSVLKESKKKIKDVQKEVTNEKQEASDSAIRDWISDIEKDIPFDAAKMKKAIDISPDFNKADSSLQLLSDLYGEVSESVHATSEEIKNNTDVLNENTDAQKKNSDSTNTSKKKKEPKNYSDTYNNKLSELGTKLSGDIKFYEGKGKNTEQYLDQLREINEEISAIKKLDVATEDDIKTLNDIEERIKIIEREASFAENKVANEKSVQKWLGQINDILSKNTSRKFKSSELYQEFVELQNAFKHFDASRPQNELDELGQKALETITKFKGLDESFKGGGFLSNFTHRLSDMNAKFLAQYFSWQDMIRYARQAITTVIQLNDAFIELSKVSNTSIKNLESDFQSYADIAKRIGGTITDTINATADWSRLGYSVPDAKQLAEVALLYKNVGDGIDIEAANESLISTLQGFQLEADDALSIIDKFNEVGNNFAISSAGIGEALQRSAAAFNAANTDLSQSIALITASNEIVQDPDAVGSMWTTVSARIRGADTELQNLGEDTDEYVESTSKLRDLIKGITGVDIMLDENTFKDIYTIVVQIGEKWNDINDIDQANCCLCA